MLKRHIRYWLNRDPANELGFQKVTRPWVKRISAEVRTYSFVENSPITEIDALGLVNWGPVGGKCCNNGSNLEWAVVGGGIFGGPGVWVPVPPGACTGSGQDCDAMTCKGGLYKIPGLGNGGSCTDSPDDDSYGPRRWTPGCFSGKPKSGLPEPPQNFVGGPPDAPPPGYVWTM